MAEIIKQIDEIYSVSSEGKFFKNGKERKGSVNNYGYIQVSLYRKLYLLHRLVALAFPEICGEWFEGAQVDHINTIKDDNKAINLRFVSCKTNNNNPLTREHRSEALKGENHPLYGKHHTEETLKKLSKPVLQFSKDGNLIKEWQSGMQIERELGYHNSNINQCCLNKRKSANGFIWRFKDNNKCKNSN